MSYCGYVTTLKDVRPHPNADRLVLATCFNNTVCIAKDKYSEGELGVYFPTDGQLSVEFCEQNGLFAVYVNGVNTTGGYMDPAKRNVKAIKLRGEQSDGLFLPITCLAYTHAKLDEFKPGDQITVVNGHEICRKYIPRGNAPKTVAGGAGKRVKRRAKRSIAPVFFEHKDTEQLAYNLHMFKPGDLIEITRKLHGTSGRTSHTKVLKGFKRTLLDRILGREGEPIYDWGYVTGTRRTVLDTFDGGFYGSNEFRKPYHDFFEGKLLKGETVYYEIVGFTHDGGPIMGVCNNKKLNDKEFVKKYGETTTFSYGCVPSGKKTMYGTDDRGPFEIEVDVPKNDIYVYRMTMTNEDGEVVEYTPDQMRHRCMYMDVKTVPVHWYGFIPEEEVFTGTSCEYTDAGEFVLAKAEEFFDGEEPIDPTHIREGVVVRVINRPTFTAYKHKNFQFKVLEGIIKETAEAPDMEEADGLEENNE
jgi:hypothetical protein